MARAKGKYAKAISDRSGLEFPYNEMLKEWNGSLVHKSEFETRHPQDEPSKHAADAESLKNGRPDRSEPTSVYVGGVGFFDHNDTMQPQVRKSPTVVPMIGQVTVSTS